MAKYCVKCGKTLPDGAEMCPDCNAAAAQEREAALFTHMSPDAEVWKTAEPVKTKPKRARSFLRNAWFYVAGALLIAAAVILILFGQPAARVARALRSGDIDRALQIYWSTPRLYESEERSEKIDSAIMDAARSLCDQYADHTMDADTAATKLAQLGTFGDASAKMLEETYAEFRSFSGSQSHMGEGDKRYAIAEYLEAREEYLLVLPSDADYDAAQEKAADCLIRYGEHTAQQAEALMQKSDYPAAIALLNEGNEILSRNYDTFSDTIDALLPEAYDRYEKFLLTEAANLAGLEDYDAAYSKIADAVPTFPTERPALTEALAAYEDDARGKRLKNAGARADELYNAGAYAEAFTELEDFISRPDEDTEGAQALLETMEQRFAEDCSREARTAYDAKRENLEAAIDILDWGLGIRELEPLKEYRDELTELLPLYLAEAEFASKEGIIFRNSGDFKALNGETYSKGWIWGADGAQITFAPDGRYDMLEATFVTRRDDDVEASGQFEIWCDGEKVYTADALVHPHSDEIFVKLEITGCKELKIVFLCDYEVSTAENGYCYHGLCDANLTKNVEEIQNEVNRGEST